MRFFIVVFSIVISAVSYGQSQGVVFLKNDSTGMVSDTLYGKIRLYDKWKKIQVSSKGQTKTIVLKAKNVLRFESHLGDFYSAHSLNGNSFIRKIIDGAIDYYEFKPEKRDNALYPSVLLGGMIGAAIVGLSDKKDGHFFISSDAFPDPEIVPKDKWSISKEMNKYFEADSIFQNQILSGVYDKNNLILAIEKYNNLMDSTFVKSTIQKSMIGTIVVYRNENDSCKYGQQFLIENDTVHSFLPDSYMAIIIENVSKPIKVCSGDKLEDCTLFDLSRNPETTKYFQISQKDSTKTSVIQPVRFKIGEFESNRCKIVRERVVVSSLK